MKWIMPRRVLLVACGWGKGNEGVSVRERNRIEGGARVDKPRKRYEAVDSVLISRLHYKVLLQTNFY